MKYSPDYVTIQKRERWAVDALYMSQNHPGKRSYGKTWSRVPLEKLATTVTGGGQPCVPPGDWSRRAAIVRFIVCPILLSAYEGRRVIFAHQETHGPDTRGPIHGYDVLSPGLNSSTHRHLSLRLDIHPLWSAGRLVIIEAGMGLISGGCFLHNRECKHHKIGGDLWTVWGGMHRT